MNTEAATGGESLGFGPELSADEEKFFSTGGESAIPADGNGEGSGNPDGDNNPPADPADKGAKGKEPQHVPLAALQEERAKRKADRAIIEELRGKVSNFEGKFSVLERLNQKPGAEAEPPAEPTVEEDVFAVIKKQGETLADMQKRAKEEKEASDKKAKDDADETTFKNNYVADANAFEKRPENSDYRQAYNFLLQSRANELIGIGYDDPQALIAAGHAPTSPEVQAAAKALHDALVADERGIAILAFNKQKSPAETIYNLAKLRGYKKADGSAPPAQNNNGKGAEKLDAIERGQATHKSLNSAGGSGGGDEMTAERLLAMPLDEFEAWTEKNPAKARRILGG